MTFKWQEIDNHNFLQLEAWLQTGVLHGFSAKDFSFCGDEFKKDTKCLSNLFGAKALYLLHQMHGTSYIDLRQEEALQAFITDSATPKADAFILSLNNSQQDKYIFAIKTADCVPIMIKQESSLALIHGGWRGLAAGIVEKVLEAFDEASNAPFEVLIGPCAGPERYEVGVEVIEAFGARAICQSLGNDKFLLDLAQSTENIVKSSGHNIKRIYKANICTIADTIFHSFRREGEARGNNLCFLVV